MKVGIISYYNFETYIKNNKDTLIYESWNKAWLEVFKLSKKKNIELVKYDPKFHLDYENIIYRDSQNKYTNASLFSNTFKKKIYTIL